MSIPTLVTKNCSRDNCSIVLGASGSTLLGWTQTFDRHGNPISKNPNYVTTQVRCDTCGVRWSVKQHGDDEPVVTCLDLATPAFRRDDR
jgi:hypothetical protein